MGKLAAAPKAVLLRTDHAPVVVVDVEHPVLRALEVFAAIVGSCEDFQGMGMSGLEGSLCMQLNWYKTQTLTFAHG